jgi:hypothetical protein
MLPASYRARAAFDLGCAVRPSLRSDVERELLPGHLQGDVHEGAEAGVVDEHAGFEPTGALEAGIRASTA